MMSLIEYYFLGKAVDNTANYVLDRIHKNTSEQNQKLLDHYRTPAKVASYWMLTSGILSIATIPWMPPAAAYSIGIGGTIPFVKPLLTGLCSHIVKCYNSLNTTRKVQSIAAIATVSTLDWCIQRYALNHSQRSYIPLTLLLTNVPLDTGLLVTTELVRSEENSKRRISPTPSASTPSSKSVSSNIGPSNLDRLNEYVDLEKEEARKQVQDLELKLALIKTFLNKNEELRKLFQEYLQKDQHVVNPAKTDVKLDSNDSIDEMTSLKLRAIDLEQIIIEGTALVERNPELNAAFLKQLNAQSAQNDHVPASAAANNSAATLEEIT